MDVNDLNLSKNRLERFLLRKRGGRSVPTTIEPLVILPENKLKEKGSLTPFKYALKYAHLDMERWSENQQRKQQQEQQTRKRKNSFNKENAPNLSDEHINKLARKQRGSRFTSNSSLTSGQKFVIKPYIDNNNNDNENYKQSQIKESFSFKRQPMSDKTRNNDNNNNDTLRQSSPSIQSNYSAPGSTRSNRSAIKPYVDKKLQQQRRSSSSPKRQTVEEKSSNNDDNRSNNNESNNTQQQTSISVQSARSVADSMHSNQSESTRPSITENRFVSKPPIDDIDHNSLKQQQEHMMDDKAIIDKNTVHENLSLAHSTRDSIHSKTSAVDGATEQSLSADLINERHSQKLASQIDENNNDKSGTDKKDSLDNIVQEEENHPALPTSSNQKIEKSNNNDTIMDKGNVEEAPVALQKDDILDDLTEFEIEYDYGDDGGVFVGQEQQPQQQQDRSASPVVPVSQFQKQQQQQVNNRMESFRMDNDDNDRDNLDITQGEHFEFLPLTRLPKSRQEQRRAGTIIANECDISKLVYNMPINPTQEEMETVQQKIFNSFIKTAKISKVKPIIELFKELGTVAMNCANEVPTQNDYQHGAVDMLAEVLRKKLHDHAEIFRKLDDLRFKGKRIKLTHDHAEKRLLNTTSNRRKLNDEINEMRKRCEKLRAEREINTNIIKFFDRINNPIPKTPDDDLHEEVDVLKTANKEQQTKYDVRPEEINVSQYTTDGHKADKTDVSETNIETIGD
ncbi:hypothetical protein INT45_012081 [Circinella minor]|uniref:Uncharacterized protein n=1 Tax=Circinella minor TaxID=1195481 RepID=A0A8H7SH62_9FUNG|nr:hypothetical protein INT45_012081 [Circinella minor]